MLRDPGDEWVPTLIALTLLALVLVAIIGTIDQAREAEPDQLPEECLTETDNGTHLRYDKPECVEEAEND